MCRGVDADLLIQTYKNLIVMAKVTNPFIVRGVIPPEYFCDREQETKKLVGWLTNGNNVVLIASRRIGKSRLIDHCFEQPELKDAYYKVFVDIMQTGNIQEFTYELGKAVFDTLSPVSNRLAKLFMQTVQSLHGEFGIDPITGHPKFSFSLGHISNPTYTLDEIFRFLEQADKPCLIAIDEFQRIADYPESNVEAILRTHIQRMSNCGFIFSGSERHMLGQMFLDSNRPFYSSASIMNLEEIRKDKYCAFAMEHFSEFGKRIEAANVIRVYDLFSGNTFALQKTMNMAFMSTPDKGECTLNIIHEAIDDILEDNTYEYRNRLMTMGSAQKQVLYAIGKKGKVAQITGAEFINRNKLGSASSVQSAMRKLLTDGWVTEYTDDEGKKVYHLTDYFLTLWIQQKYGMGYTL